MNKVFYYKDYSEKFYVFRDRIDAGEKLSNWLLSEDIEVDVVLGIPAGGIPLAYIVSKKLGSKLDVLICRKIPIPWNREAGFGAVSPNGSYFIDEEIIRYFGLSEREISEAVEEQLCEIKRRIVKYRCGEDYRDLSTMKVLVIDDGVAAGYTMVSAIKFLYKLNASEINIAVPTCHVKSIYRVLAENPSRVYCMNPRSALIYAVADAYVQWVDLGDSDVIYYLRKAFEENRLCFKGNCLK